jgi:phage tail tube protein FII
MPIVESGQLLTLEAANLFAGATAPGDVHASNHLRLLNVKLPGMVEEYLDHRPGGSWLGIEIDVQINKLQCDFTLAGWSLQAAQLIQAMQTSQTKFWVFGVIRDRLSGAAYQAQAVITGRLGRADPSAWERGRVHSWDYSIRGIQAYWLSVGDPNLGVQTLWDWSFATNTLKVGN